MLCTVFHRVQRLQTNKGERFTVRTCKVLIEWSYTKLCFLLPIVTLSPPRKVNLREKFGVECMHWEIHRQMFLLYPLKVYMYLCTFWHPHFRFRNVPMSTSLKHCSREILVLVYHMWEEGLELCKFKLSNMKAFFGWRDSPAHKLSSTDQ